MDLLSFFRKTPEPTMNLFYEWLKTKDPNEKYHYMLSSVCACGQFAQSIGYKKRWMSEVQVDDPENLPTNFWTKADWMACRADDRTFGSLTALVEQELAFERQDDLA